MGNNEQGKIERLTFYQELLADTIDAKRYPWYRMIVEKRLGKEEVDEVYELFNELGERKESLREAGMLDQTPLLLHYVGMLNSNLDPFMTANALNKQGYYESMTAELITMMEQNESQVK